MSNQSSRVTLHWYLPTYGDSRSIMAGGHGAGFHSNTREPSLDYLTQIAQAAEYNGFESLLTPTGSWCADAWLTTAALAARTERLKFLVALRPGLVSPTLIAQQALTFQDLFRNRLLLNVVVGGEDAEQRAYGDYLTKEQRYARASEVLSIIRKLWTDDEPVTADGEFQKVDQAQLSHHPSIEPTIFFGGSSQPGIESAAQYADTYLTWGEPPAAAGEKIARVRHVAEEFGRSLDYGVRLHVIARPTAEEAWSEAERMLEAIDPEQVRKVQEGLAKSQSEGQRRMTALHNQGGAFGEGSTARDLEIYPGLWTGVGLVRGGAGTALVGSYDDVARLTKEYIDQGFNHFILSGYPHLEETFHVGEGVVPALQRLGVDVKNHETSDTQDGERRD